MSRTQKENLTSQEYRDKQRDRYYKYIHGIQVAYRDCPECKEEGFIPKETGPKYGACLVQKGNCKFCGTEYILVRTKY